MKKSSLLCCDWGTSNFRLYLLDIISNKILGMVKTDQGIAYTFEAWKQDVSRNRIAFFRNFLNKEVKRLSNILERNLDDIPIILSGMASSSIGMEEISYAKVPFSLHQPSLFLKHFLKNDIYSNELFIYGGLRTENDVMRGEEVQLLGISHLIDDQKCVCLLPGTHSKHIWIENQQVVDFQTFMTGESFQFICTHSILKGSVDSSDTFNRSQQEMFKKGILEAQSGNILNSLFRTRTNTLLKGISKTNNYYYLSGLLIGQELSALLNFQGQLILSSSKHLAKLYQLALTTVQLDQHLTLVTPSDMEQCIPRAHLKLFQNI